ncbi:hypothetical protein K458DRAFT_411546 [Lentithecium fluviatile CBS 122367]|uniref:Protein YAE1 n=1 Tax=Lentithecium fluviatile CBS 122367 TaxID=1168545 RepID=A0A6G1JNV4_9PLEO|nr:hypothetical protein K458DRAFT_411546 [Lentithecium fluviatile CBS 122367]
MLRELSPSLGPTYLPGGNTPPTPPHNDPLDDIYGSEPSSPLLSSLDPLQNGGGEHGHEMLSDLPSRQRALDTDAYREGLSNSKGQYVQEGFDEGYSLGANLGLLVGYILGILRGLTTALQGHDEVRWAEVKDLWEDAQKQLAIQELLGQNWISEEGMFKWEVEGKDDDVTFKEVAEQHPVIQKWIGAIKATAREWGVDLEALEESEEAEADVERS